MFTLSDLDIMSVNSDGSLRSTTGYVEDAKAAVPPVKPSVNKPAEEPTVDENGNLIDPEPGTVSPADPGAGDLLVIDPATGEAENPEVNVPETNPTEPTTPESDAPIVVQPEPTTPELAPVEPQQPETNPPVTPDFIIIEPQPAA